MFRGSSSRMPMRSACHPSAASGRLRTSSASRAKTGLEDQRRNARTPSPDRAAAWRRHCRMISERFCHAAFSPFISVSAVITRARRVAMSGSSHPRTGDQRSVEGSPDMPCGSNTVTGLPPCSTGLHRDHQVVGARGCRDHSARRIEDGIDDHVEALTGSRSTLDDHRFLRGDMDRDTAGTAQVSTPRPGSAAWPGPAA